MKHRTFQLIGATGGSGTTSLALMLALEAKADFVVGNTDDITAIAGAPDLQITPQLTVIDTHPGRTPGQTVIVDAGTLAHPRPTTEEADIRLCVVRGPSFIAVHRLSTINPDIDGIVLVTEPGRVLSASDVTQATGRPVVASIAIDPTVARAIDAGIITSRRPRPLAAQLRRLASFDPQ